MEQKTYLSTLAKRLKKLPKEEVREVLSDYENHFAFARSKGRSDSEIIQGLGEPQKIAKEILVQYEIIKADENPSLNSVSKAVFAAAGLGMLNLLFVLAPFILILFILFALYGLGVFFLLSPGILLIQDGFTLIFLKEIFLIFGLIGLGILIQLSAWKFSKLVYRYSIQYLTFNLKMIRRKSV